MVPAISDVMEPKRHVVWLPWLLHVVRCFPGSRLGVVASDPDSQPPLASFSAFRSDSSG